MDDIMRPTRLRTFREQVMDGQVPLGYQGLVEVAAPGVVKVTDDPVAAARDVTPGRVAYLMRDANDAVMEAPADRPLSVNAGR